MKLNAWTHLPVISMLLAVQSLLLATSAQAQEPPKPPQIVAKPAYVELVKAMREDEFYLLAYKASLEESKHSYHARCFANLKASHLTRPLAWTMTWSLSEQEATEAKAFFDTDLGRKWVSREITIVEKKLKADDPAVPKIADDEVLEIARFVQTPAGNKLIQKRVTREKAVVDTVKGEMRERLYNCTETLAGTKRINYCESPYLPNPEKTCSARYSVAGMAGGKSRETVVSYYCEKPRGGGAALSVPGQHESVGLLWHENQRLEVLLPAGVKPEHPSSAHKYGGPKVEYRERRPTDAPAVSCAPNPPLDELGWPLSEQK